nr:transposase [Streptomyces sp. DHE17-7]
MRQLAPLFGISPATVCRVIQRLGPMLALEPARACADATDRLWIVDGTLVPVRDRKVGASSRNYRFSANVQVIVDAETRLVVATARPFPAHADAKMPGGTPFGLAATLQGMTVLGDAPTINTGSDRSPRKTPAGRSLLKGEEEDNAQHRKVRARVEHTFSRMKNYKILRDCRQRGDGLHHRTRPLASHAQPRPSPHDHDTPEPPLRPAVDSRPSATPFRFVF